MNKRQKGTLSRLKKGPWSKVKTQLYGKALRKIQKVHRNAVRTLQKALRWRLKAGLFKIRAVRKKAMTKTETQFAIFDKKHERLRLAFENGQRDLISHNPNCTGPTSGTALETMGEGEFFVSPEALDLGDKHSAYLLEFKLIVHGLLQRTSVSGTSVHDSTGALEKTLSDKECF